MNLRTITLFFLLNGFFNLLQAQLPANCSGTNPRIAIAGDSWAQYMADDGTHSETLKMYGHADKVAISETFEMCIGCGGSPGSSDYAISGSEAREWADEANYDYLQNLIDALNANPTVDWVVLSIGGNDILAARSNGGWYKDMDLDIAGSEAALFNTTKANTEYIMNQVWLRARANINFLISGYDYPNFNVTSFCDQYACPKREDLSRDANNSGSIEASELITDVEINSMMQVVEAMRQNLASTNSKIFYDNGMGLMHYYYGYDDGLYSNINAGTTAYPLGIAPYTIGGDPNTPSDRDNFRPVGVFGWIGWFGADPIHLDTEGYQYKIKNQFDNTLFENYRGNPDLTVWSNGNEDGYVDVQYNTFSTDGLKMGDEDVSWFGLDYEYRSILSFNTSTIPVGATVTGASIYLFRSSADDNPFLHTDRNPVLDIKNGHFGTSSALEAIDGTASADADDIGCFHGNGDQNKYAIRIDVNGSALNHININGTTQFRLSFDYADWSTELINFYDGGGIAGRQTNTSNESEAPLYTHRVVERTENPDGTITEVELSRGEEVTKREGLNQYEKLKSAVPSANSNSTIMTFKSMAAIEHPGLSKHMSEVHSAPSNGLTPFIDISYTTILPVELTQFTAFANENKTELNWKTASEKEVDGFYIQHSIDGKSWEDLHFITATNHETSTTYEHQHLTPQIGANYYRLRIVDLDGSTEFSVVRVVNFNKKRNLIVYPNPFRDRLIFEVNQSRNTKATAYLINSIGQVVYQKYIQLKDNQEVYVLNKLDGLEKGIYLLRIEGEGISWNEKVIRF